MENKDICVKDMDAITRVVSVEDIIQKSKKKQSHIT